jgi:ribosomal small subunit protein bTHX
MRFLIGHVALIAVASGYQLAACRTASAVVTPTAAVAPVARTGDVLMGRGDKRTAKGKRKAKSFGVSRPSSRNLRVAKFGPGPNTGDITAAAAPAPAPAAPKMADIVDTAVGAGAFKTLAAALGAAGLVDTMKSAGPFTVFAPTDAAFAKLPAGTVEELLKPENKDQLRDILLLHVVPGKVAAADVVKLSEAKTAGGGTLSISATDGVKVGTASGSATVVKTDIPAKNGLIHVIDSVLLP